jgi:hypothetical protein
LHGARTAKQARTVFAVYGLPTGQSAKFERPKLRRSPCGIVITHAAIHPVLFDKDGKTDVTEIAIAMGRGVNLMLKASTSSLASSKPWNNRGGEGDRREGDGTDPRGRPYAGNFDDPPAPA